MIFCTSSGYLVSFILNYYLKGLLLGEKELGMDAMGNNSWEMIGEDDIAR